MKRLGTADRFKSPKPICPKNAYSGVFAPKRKDPPPPTTMTEITPTSDENGFGVSTKRFASYLGNNISEQKNYSPIGVSYYRRNTIATIGRSTPYEVPDMHTR